MSLSIDQLRWIQPKKTIHQLDGRQLNLLLSLPDLLQSVVYSYDNTKVDHFKHVLADIQKPWWPHIRERKRVILYIKYFIGSQKYWNNGYGSAGNIKKLFGGEYNLNYKNHYTSERDFKVLFSEDKNVLFYKVLPVNETPGFWMHYPDGYFINVDQSHPQRFYLCEPSVLVTVSGCNTDKRKMYILDS